MWCLHIEFEGFQSKHSTNFEMSYQSMSYLISRLNINPELALIAKTPNGLKLRKLSASDRRLSNSNRLHMRTVIPSGKWNTKERLKIFKMECLFRGLVGVFQRYYWFILRIKLVKISTFVRCKVSILPEILIKEV